MVTATIRRRWVLNLGQIKGDEMYPTIDRKELQEKVLMPLIQSFK